MADERVTTVRLSAKVNEYIEGLRQARQETERLNAEAKAVAERKEAFKQLGQVMVGIGGVMTAVAVSVAKTGIEYNTLQQRTRAALSTLLGGARAANAQMDKLDEFARTSPFAKQTFITAQQQMLAFGIEARKVVPYLDAIQDAVAAAGGSNKEIAEIAFIMSQISAASKITATDLMQLGQRGVNAAELIGSQMGMTGAEIRASITAGTLDADAALDALAAGMKERFAGAAANVKLTFEGAIDRVRAAWRDMSADLMKPIVNPEGGGVLVDLLNWTADVMRNMQKLPEPIKNVMGLTFALVGVFALVGGTAILAIPKVVAFNAALATLGITGASVRSRLSGITGFLGGPWGIALLAATALVITFNKAIEAGVPTQAKIINAIKTTRSSVDGLKSAFERGKLETTWAGDYARELENLPELLDRAAGAGWRWAELTFQQQGALDSLSKYGDALAEVANTDLPMAQLRFRELADAYGLNEAQMMQLLDEMPAFRDALVGVATEIGLTADDSTLLGLALGKIGPGADDAAGALAKVEEAAGNAEDALTEASRALRDLSDASIQVGASHDRALSSINAMVEAAKVEGVTLDGTNDASIRFRDSVRDVEQRHRDSAEAIIENGGALEDAQAEWEAGREKVIEMAESLGLSRDEAVAWAETSTTKATEVASHLKKVKTAWDALEEQKRLKLEAETKAAQSAIDLFVERNDGRTVSIYANTIGFNDATGYRQPGMPGSTNNERGGFYAYANGGIVRNLRSGIYPGGAEIHKFAEKSLPWEAYISPKPDERERNFGVWQTAGQLLGFLQKEKPSAPVSLDGVAISGRLDLGNGLVGFIDGRIEEAFPSQGGLISEVGH
ncbi:tape measure protein [Microbacterium sp. YY-01]|uniref:tape measure protein n=1 Tax=Microbacterium sp. YY-01 TaxID=3421634 RepID=UPI003D16CADE